MFAFAKQLVRSAEGIISNPQGFNAQNPTHDNYHGSATPKGDPTHGFRVVQVVEGSPAFKAGIQSLFDFIIGINGHDIVGQQIHPIQQVQQTHQMQHQLTPSQSQHSYDPNFQHQPQHHLDSISEYGTSNFYTPPPQNPYAPSQQLPSASTQNYYPEPTHPKVHHRSVSFSSTSNIIPQLVPPHPEHSPLDPFIAEVANCRGRSISLEVWSSKGRTRRTIVLPVPSAEDNQTGSPSSPNDERSQSLGVGLSLQWTPLSVADHVWHVLNVAHNSPAEVAGLISHSDYIVGAENGLLESGGEDLLGRVVQKLVLSHDNHQKLQQQHQLQVNATQNEDTLQPGIVDSQAELELFVYNHDYDTLRAVRIRPTSNWGGSGLLGCGVGYGLLHRLPAINGQEPNPQTDNNNNNNNNFQQVAHRRHFSGSNGPPGVLDSVSSPAIPEEDESEYPPVLPAGTAPPTSDSYFTPANLTTLPGSMAFVPAATAPSIPLPGPSPLSPTGVHSTQRKKKHHYPTVGTTLPPTPIYPPPGTAADNNDNSNISGTHQNHVNTKINNDLAAYFAEEEQRSKELDGYSTIRNTTPSQVLPPPPPPPSSSTNSSAL